MLLRDRTGLSCPFGRRMQVRIWTCFHDKCSCLLVALSQERRISRTHPDANDFHRALPLQINRVNESANICFNSSNVAPVKDRACLSHMQWEPGWLCQTDMSFARCTSLRTKWKGRPPNELGHTYSSLGLFPMPSTPANSGVFSDCSLCPSYLRL